MNHDHLVSHIHHPELASDNTLHVVGVVSNPVRYHSRYRLFRQWVEEMRKTPNVQLHIVELAFGDRRYEIDNIPGVNVLRLRSDQTLWHKENMINLGVRHLLPQDWKYLCWCDADLTFRNDGWALETIHQLQHAHLIQPFRHCLDLGFNGDVLQTHHSFCYVHSTGERKQTCHTDPYRYAHSGYAWACDREFWENVGGLMDFPILGSADHHMAWASIGQVDMSIPNAVSPSYKVRCLDWQRKAFRVTKGNLGFVDGRVEHHWHGSKAKRFYQTRWQIFAKNAFNPDAHLVYDRQGLLRLVNADKLATDIGKYMSSRCEDSIDP